MAFADAVNCLSLRGFSRSFAFVHGRVRSSICVSSRDTYGSGDRLDQGGGLYSECASKCDNVEQRDIALSSLDSADIVPVEVR